MNVPLLPEEVQDWLGSDEAYDIVLKAYDIIRSKR